MTAAALAATTVLPGLAATGAAAAPAGCDPQHGVVVVVDFGHLRHADVNSCVPDGGGRDAADLLTAVGLSLADVQRQPGFVCRIDGLPSDDPCVNTPPTDAYWSLWWAPRGAATWSYSTVMASALDVPAGGVVAMVWQEDAEEREPSAALLSGAHAGSASATPASAAVTGDASARPARADAGLPGWVAPVAIVALFGTAGTVAAVRRRRGPA